MCIGPEMVDAPATFACSPDPPSLQLHWLEANVGGKGRVVDFLLLGLVVGGAFVGFGGHGRCFGHDKVRKDLAYK